MSKDKNPPEKEKQSNHHRCQLEGLKIDRVFTDKVSGKDIKRPQLEGLLKFVREGDTVICHSVDRLGRNLVDLRKTVTELTSRKIGVRFLKENLVLTGDDSPWQRFS